MYKLTNSTSIVRIADGASIPADPANTDYAEYLIWLSQGNTPEPYVEPELTTQQKLAKLDADNALTQRNLRETIMLMAGVFKTVTGGAVDLSQIPGVSKVFEVEKDAKILREKL